MGRGQPDKRIVRLPLRRAGLGIVVGLALGMVGQLAKPGEPSFRPFDSAYGLVHAMQQIDDGEYRITMRCPVRNKQVSYQVKAAHAGRAHMALEWVLPACELDSLAAAGAADQGQSWYVGKFACSGTFFRRTLTLTANDLRHATARAREAAPGCRVDTVDQTLCSAVTPLCRLESEDFRLEAELSQVHLLR